MDEQRVREIVREELEKAAAESFKRFGQKLQQPEDQAMIKEIFGKALYDAFAVPDFQGAIDKFLEILSQTEEASPEVMNPILCELLIKEFNKMTLSDLKECFEGITLHPESQEIRLILVFPIKHR